MNATVVAAMQVRIRELEAEVEAQRTTIARLSTELSEAVEDANKSVQAMRPVTGKKGKA